MRRLRRAQRDLYWLCKEVLGYDRLTDGFHAPMLGDIDRQRRRGVRFGMELWPRGHYKSTFRVGQMVQDILIDPDVTCLVVHAVEDEAQKLAQEVGQHFQANKELRALLPEIMPSVRDKRFVTASGFTVKRGRFSRQPTVLAKGSSAEITGAHVDRIYLDDIVGRKTIEDSGLPKVKSWYRSTVLPVLNPGGSILVTGTRWDLDDPYGGWLKSKAWVSRVRAALETDGKPDYKGSPVLFPAEEIDRLRSEMGETDFAFQMMNDPSPSSEKPWDAGACEHYCGMGPGEDSPAAAGPGAVFVLSDPAPAKEGGLRQDGEKARADGSKDDWAIAVVKLKVHNGMQIGILLDLSSSKEWTKSAGLDEACRLMRKWGTNKFFNESYGGLIADYTEEMKKAGRRNGVPVYLDRGGQLPTFKASYGRGAKNQRFSSLADWARTGRFWICAETVPEGELEKFLTQARSWLPLPNGRNTNKFDDSGDVVSRITDPALQDHAPRGFVEHEFEPWSPFRVAEEEEPSRGSRYVRF